VESPELAATPKFEGKAIEAFGSEMSYWVFQEFILRNPAHGRVIPGTGGARKIRWSDPGRGRGTRGGLRVIYFWFESHLFIVLVDVYDKGEKDDLTAAERDGLRRDSAEIREELATRRRT